MQISRRAILGAAVLLVAGCDRHVKPNPPVQVATPDLAALVSARNIERLLLASYDAEIARASARHLAVLQVARAIHASHLVALHGTAASTADLAVVTNVRHELRVSAATLRGLALAATNGTNAALLASIAASHETSAR